MDILDIGPAFKAAIGQLRAFAEARVNWYFPHVNGVPGDNPGYVLDSGTLRLVFTWTVIDDEGQAMVFRHLSVSTRMRAPGSTKLPNQIITYTVASLLGFTGATMSGDVAVAPGLSWGVEISPPGAIPHVMLVEHVPEAAVTTSGTSN